MTDNGGMICAKRFVNERRPSDSPPLHVALVSISSMDFWGPMFVGDLAEVEAKVVLTSRSSVQVQVSVFADNLEGSRRLTNQATLWYVAVRAVAHGGRLVLADGLPAVEHASAQALDEYARQKARRSGTASAGRESLQVLDVSDPSWTAHLCQLILPSDCYSSDFVQGGVVLKLMDNAAGIAAARHCRSNVVTASLESLDFVAPVFRGNLVTVVARPTYASSKSLEIQVLVQAEDLAEGRSWTAVTAYLIFVSLGPDGRPLPVPPLAEPATPREVAEREAAGQRYADRKVLLVRRSKAKPT